MVHNYVRIRFQPHWLIGRSWWKNNKIWQRIWSTSGFDEWDQSTTLMSPAFQWFKNTCLVVSTCFNPSLSKRKTCEIPRQMIFMFVGHPAPKHLAPRRPESQWCRWNLCPSPGKGGCEKVIGDTGATGGQPRTLRIGFGGFSLRSNIVGSGQTSFRFLPWRFFRSGQTWLAWKFSNNSWTFVRGNFIYGNSSEILMFRSIIYLCRDLLLPSGKLSWLYWKWTLYRWFTYSNIDFPVRYANVYQRVDTKKYPRLSPVHHGSNRYNIPPWLVLGEWTPHKLGVSPLGVSIPPKVTVIS